jgi:hypothetical protein
MEVWRDVGVAGYAAIALVGTAVVVLWRRSSPTGKFADADEGCRTAA